MKTNEFTNEELQFLAEHLGAQQVKVSPDGETLARVAWSIVHKCQIALTPLASAATDNDDDDANDVLDIPDTDQTADAVPV